MILEYHRPTSLEEALSLLSRTGIETVPLGGGTVLNHPSPRQLAVVDLQNLGLNSLQARGHRLTVGATLSLEALLAAPGLPAALTAAIRHEATFNLRQIATVAGTLVAADGRSPFATAMLALDAQLVLLPRDEQISLGDLLSFRSEKLRGRLIARITFPTNVRLAYEYVARSPADLPIVCAAATRWPSGRTRLALGGFGSMPKLALDGPEPGGAEIAARNAYSQTSDEWATAEYRQEIAGILARRCLQKILVAD